MECVTKQFESGFGYKKCFDSCNSCTGVLCPDALEIIQKAGECEHIIKQEKNQEEKHCDWCKSGKEVCGTCLLFFDYYQDGGSNKCSADYLSKDRCSLYKPVIHCPNCGRKL